MRLDAAAARRHEASPEEKAVADEVGGVEAVDRERDDVVEGDGRAEADEAEEDGGRRREGDGGEGERGSRVDLDRVVSCLRAVLATRNAVRGGNSDWVSCVYIYIGHALRFTLLRYFQPGVPLSRAKLHVIRDAVATKLIVPHMSMMTIRDDMVRAPAVDPTACWKMAMKG